MNKIRVTDFSSSAVVANVAKVVLEINYLWFMYEIVCLNLSALELEKMFSLRSLLPIDVASSFLSSSWCWSTAHVRKKSWMHLWKIAVVVVSHL